MKIEKIDQPTAHATEVCWDSIKPGQFLLVKFPLLRKKHILQICLQCPVKG